MQHAVLACPECTWFWTVWGYFAWTKRSGSNHCAAGVDGDCVSIGTKVQVQQVGITLASGWMCICLLCSPCSPLVWCLVCTALLAASFLPSLMGLPAEAADCSGQHSVTGCRRRVCLAGHASGIAWWSGVQVTMCRQASALYCYHALRSYPCNPYQRQQ